MFCDAADDTTRCGGGGGDESAVALLFSWDNPLLRGVTEVTGSLLVLVLVMDSSSLSYARIASFP